MDSVRTAVTLLVVAAVLAAGYIVPRLDLDAGPAGRSAVESRSDAPAHGCRDAHVLPFEDLAAAESATLCLLNAERRARRRRPLRDNRQLRVAALRHSRDMVERDFFDHVNPDGLDAHRRIVRAGYRLPRSGGVTGENLASAEEEKSTPAEIVEGWMHSPGHRRNILRPAFREIGIGILPEATDYSHPDNRGATYTTTFGRRY